MDQQLYGGIEIGGTKVMCAVGDDQGTISGQVTFKTASVDATMQAIAAFFAGNKTVRAVGVGSFGPLQLNPNAADFGHIYHSPKAGWEQVDLKGLLETRLQLPISLETDVNCAALGELHFGVARQVKDFIYLTVGTGIGGALVRDGKIVHGVQNLEMGHVRVPHQVLANGYSGSCPFHGDCLEGLASGFALYQQYAQAAETIIDPSVWDQEASYLASAIHNLMLTNGPELIVIGGGVADHEALLPAIRTKVAALVNDYLVFPDLDDYIVAASGPTNGVLGALQLAVAS